MFNKKNDPLVESVKAVMKQNEVHRQAEAALNEELGISSKKALPHEYHAQYDALLEEKVKMTPVKGNQDKIDVSGPKGKPDNMVSKHDFEELGLRSKKAAGKLEEKATEEQKAKIKKVMSHWKAGKQHIGKSEETVPKTKEGQKQAVAIALNQAKLSKKINENEYFETESVIDEIRENLEANLIAIHESGDDELFENYVNSLTEEELEILGLNETSLPEPGFMGRALSKVGLNTPQVKQQNALRAGIESMAGPSQKPAPALNPLAQHRIGQPSVSPIERQPNTRTAYTSLPARDKDTSPAPEAPATSLPARDKDTSPAPEAPAATQRQTPAATQPRQQQRPAPVAKPADTSSYGQRVGDAYRSGSEFTSRGERNPFASISESKQIKESLESFLRNRFLKG